MNRQLASTLSLVVGSCAFASTALAQESDLSVEGPGYPISEGTVFHPTLGAELGFIDNVFFEEDSPDASGLLRLIAEAAIASEAIQPDVAGETYVEGDGAPAEPAKQQLRFRFGGRLAYTEFLSGEEAVRAQRDLEADVNGHLVVNPEGAVAFELSERFTRDTRPTNFESTDSANRLANNLMLGVMFQPGGRTLRFGARWENTLDYFEDPDQRFANRMINVARARAEWLFFPYSLAFLDFSYGFVGQLGSAESSLAKRSAQPIRGGIGLATAITELFTVKANLGWAYASYEGGASYNSPIGGAEVGFRYSPLGRVVAEYKYDIADSINADFFRDHMLGAHIDQQLGRIVASALGEVHWRSYRGIPMTVGEPDREDLIVAVGLRGQYAFKDWMSAVAQLRTELDETSYRSMFGGQVDDPSFRRTEVTVGVRAAF